MKELAVAGGFVLPRGGPVAVAGFAPSNSRPRSDAALHRFHSNSKPAQCCCSELIILY